MSSFIPYKACTKDPKFVWGNPVKCLANLGCKLLKIILIWSCSEGWSTICAIFSLHREINEVTDSFNPYLKAFSSLLETSMTMLNANCLKNSSAKSSQVLRHETSKEANQRYAAPLKDMGKSIINWASSNPWALITVLYSIKWILGQSMLLYLSISSILNWVDKLAIGAPSKSSQLIAPSEILICLILCSSPSILVCASFEAKMGATTASRVALVWLCKTYSARCGTDWLSEVVVVPQSHTVRHPEVGSVGPAAHLSSGRS